VSAVKSWIGSGRRPSESGSYQKQSFPAATTTLVSTTKRAIPVGFRRKNHLASPPKKEYFCGILEIKRLAIKGLVTEEDGVLLS
jgi:hypothetical protein